ncbi:MAG: hypothetical protein LUH17_00415, partial [Acidaminococcaceae bacterium]|nr:hypothetical protein [Acidaminococcaceae bacterium]
LSLVLLQERLHKVQWFGIVTSIIGAVYLISKGSLATIVNLSFNFGDILFVVSMVAWALYTILVAYVSKYVSAYSAEPGPVFWDRSLRPLTAWLRASLRCPTICRYSPGALIFTLSLLVASSA